MHLNMDGQKKTNNEVSHPQDIKKLRKYNFCIRAWYYNNKHNYVLKSV